ncbi:alanyl-tRNA synthetase [Ceratobasidium sp. AG-Ba]|nr:alanyl-tRNA synthetase [Ceratobasidium sp. AG-Ba]
MPVPEIEDVWLSDLKIVGLKLTQDFGKGLNNPPSNGTEQPNFHSNTENTTFTAVRPKPIDRLAADKPGEELAPDAGIWQLYVEEATEHDNDLVKEKNGNLDVMLLFAALFSAILTAFLIESKSLLQEDSGDLMVTLLLAIAQSQQRMEQGNIQTGSPVERPAFSPPASARWINGLWFTSLALSLAAALIAMLAKEWLIAFTTSRSRSPRDYAHLHQKRLDGMNKWGALHIIDLLPFMLHVSLLLFAFGLGIYLWILDWKIAVAGITIAAISVFFYCVTVLLGAIYQSCPFVTRISKYVGTVLRPLSIGQQGRPEPASELQIDSHPEALHDDLRSLLWLVKHASDPAVSDCACQALAGLQATVPPIEGQLASLTYSRVQGGILTSIWRRMRAQIEQKLTRLKCFFAEDSSSPVLDDRGRVLRTLFEYTCAYLSGANTRRPRDLKTCQGANAARYSNALPGLVSHLESGAYGTEGVKSSIQPSGGASDFAYHALKAIDYAWNHECPEFNLDSYALLTAGELRLTAVTADYAYSAWDEPPVLTSEQSNNEFHSLGVQAEPSSPARNSLTSLHELRVRHTRTLARASILLGIHNDGMATISRYSLVGLLHSLRVSFLCKATNPMCNLSTAWPQSPGTDRLPCFNAPIVGTSFTKVVPSLDFGDEDSLISGLVRLLASPGIEALPEVETAAVQTLAVAGRILFQQWANSMKKYSVDLENDDTMTRILSNWPEIPNQGYLRYLSARTIGLLLNVATIAISQVGCKYMSALAETAVSALHRRTLMHSGRAITNLSGDYYSGVFKEFVEVIDVNSDLISQGSRIMYLQLFLVSNFGDTLIRNGALGPKKLPALLRLIAKTPGQVTEVQHIFSDLKHIMPLYMSGTSYLLTFMRNSEGFLALIEVASIEEYALLTVELITYIFQVASMKIFETPWDEDSQLAIATVPALLYAARIVVRHTVSKGLCGEQLLSCMRDVLNLLNQFKEGGELDIGDIYARVDLIAADLTAASEQYSKLQGVCEDWEALQMSLPEDGWDLRGLSEFLVD